MTRKIDGDKKTSKETRGATTKTHREPKNPTKRRAKPFTVRYLTADSEDKTRVPAAKGSAAIRGKTEEFASEEQAGSSQPSGQADGPQAAGSKSDPTKRE